MLGEVEKRGDREDTRSQGGFVVNVLIPSLPNTLDPVELADVVSEAYCAR